MTNATSFVMNGLQNARYYMLAFIDLNNNHLPDEWEPQGIARNASGDHYEFRADSYAIGSFDLSNVHDIEDISILIRDRDTNDNNLSDGKEVEMGATPPPSNMVLADNDVNADADGDGVSLIEEYGHGSDAFNSDSDGDGLSDGEEVAIGSSLINTDSDNDTLLDGYEVATMGLSPVNSDDDNDGVPTAIEVAWGNTGGVGVYSVGSDMNPGSPDSDGDNVGDLMEIAAGSSPVDGSDSSAISITTIALGMTGEPVIEWNTHSNIKSVDIKYVLERSFNLVDWVAVGEFISEGDINSTVSLSDINLNAKGFYRLRLNVE